MLSMQRCMTGQRLRAPCLCLSSRTLGTAVPRTEKGQEEQEAFSLHSSASLLQNPVNPSLYRAKKACKRLNCEQFWAIWVQGESSIGPQRLVLDKDRAGPRNWRQPFVAP